MAKTITPTKKTETKTKATKPAAPKAPRTRKEGLRKGQIKVLTVLSKIKGVLNEWKIAEKAPMGKEWLPDALFGRIGDLPEGTKTITKPTPLGLARTKLSGYPSLLELALVKGKVIDNNGKMERVWEITPSGRKALEKATS